MSESQIALVVAASVEQVTHLQKCLPDWECVSVPLNDEETAIRSIRIAPTLAIVYARKEEKNTLAICEQLRNSPQTSTTPILLIIGISKYEIAQGNAVNRMGNAAFIIAPFDKKELRARTTELLKSSAP